MPFARCSGIADMGLDDRAAAHMRLMAGVLLADGDNPQCSDPGMRSRMIQPIELELAERCYPA
ncbi:hypothetical protein MPLB_1490007 [Mesorhizobium sp. ORS 3324]|nr:hypothetical protein MPLB_1490007 [Mesorhizobium sp. ORS 3324]